MLIANERSTSIDHKMFLHVDHYFRLMAEFGFWS